MKVKMLQYFSGVETSNVQLVPDVEYDLPDELAQWLVDNRKAEVFKAKPAKKVEAAPEPKAETVSQEPRAEATVLPEKPTYTRRSKGKKR